MLANIEESQPLLFGLFLVVFYTPSVQIIGHSSTQHLSYVSSYHNIQISKEQNVGIGDLWGIRWGLEVWHIAWSCKVFRSNFKLLFLFFQAARNVSPGDLIMAWGLADASNCVVSRLRIQRLRSWCRYCPVPNSHRITGPWFLIKLRLLRHVTCSGRQVTEAV